MSYLMNPGGKSFGLSQLNKTPWWEQPNRWHRTNCMMCDREFAAHPNAKSYETRYYCNKCRKLGTLH